MHSDINIIDRVLASKDNKFGAALALFRIFASHVASTIYIGVKVPWTVVWRLTHPIHQPSISKCPLISCALYCIYSIILYHSTG
jgi:hypothetical protein